MKSRFIGQTESIHQNTKGNSEKKIGILLTNLGTPERPDAASLRKYLREFLSDPRVVEIPRLLWLAILHGIILRVRPKKSAKLYQNIWSEQGSPLLLISQSQQRAVAAKLAEQFGDQVVVDLAMRYGELSIAKALKKFQAQGIAEIIVLPLYPQYAGPTTGSTFDAVVDEIKQWRWIPSLHFLSSYHDDELYIKALANSVREYINEHGTPDKLLLSYHGMPQQFLNWGDPYYCFCQKTSRLLAEQLALTSETKQVELVTTFQSRFGKAQWLQPYTDDVLASLPKDGVKHVAIMSPAFSADCLETLDELERESRRVFMAAGGEDYHYIPALNDREDHINAITHLLLKQLQ
jgi:ferrochelatase